MPHDQQTIQRQYMHISGVVQGVGFRPFIFSLAERIGLNGFVGNDSSGCFVEIEGTPSAIATFEQALMGETPPLAHIELIQRRAIQPTGGQGFQILPSQAQANRATLISPDLNICDDCLRELFDPHDRRYLYPFINCTNCGPRYTIIKDIPYDRDKTTMANFTMCEACAREYADPHHRRFHAQPNACPKCGPQVSFVEVGVPNQPVQSSANPIQQAQQALQGGKIVAIKGVGGFHLACSATDHTAIQTLRARKRRGDKPFAIMVRDLETAQRLAHLGEAETEALLSRARPIVIAPQRANNGLSQAIAPGNNTIGCMLPYSPLHHVLFSTTCDALVMTSGNLSDEPIVIDNDAALSKLATLCDAYLLHNRDIYINCDDSVVRAWSPNPKQIHLLPIRRSRGYAPMPVQLPFAGAPTLAVGGELKAALCLANERHAFMSQHIGDMENIETLGAFERTAAHLSQLFRITPQVVVCDKHPGYLSTQWARRSGLRCVEVQHHHAHIASVMAEHALPQNAQVIGVAFDGTGYGDDGAIWGGEFFIGGYAHYQRVAHLAYVPLPGGDAAVKKPYRTALAQLWANGLAWEQPLPCVQICSRQEQGVLRQQLSKNLNCVPTSSMGRVFDAAAAMMGIRQQVDYEAQGAMQLEALAVEGVTDAYRFDFDDDVASHTMWRIGTRTLWAEMLEDVKQRLPQPTMSAKFHNAVVNLILDVCVALRQRTQVTTVALSGGCFQNVRLLSAVVSQLQSRGFEVVFHRLVPPNDGGLALGQIAIAYASEG